MGAPDRDRRLKDEAGKFKDAIPSRDIVQSTPYLSIVAASLLFGGGEREAAISLLDQWWRARQAATTNVEQERVFRVRVLNLIGLLLSDRFNPIHMELNWHYQQEALSESNDVIERSATLAQYLLTHKFSNPKTYDMLSAAARPVSDNRNACGGIGTVNEGGRYFVHRRTTLLNNTVYFLALQHDLLVQPNMAVMFDQQIEELRSILAPNA